MNTLVIKRIANNKELGYCISHLYINDKYVCDTCEDVDRGLDYKMSVSDILKLKVHGETAIPTGEYKLNLTTISPRFKTASWAKKYNGIVPRLIGVPGYDGVLIHPGNTAKDTDGCILPGLNKVKGQVLQSQATWLNLMDNYFMKYKEDWIVRIERTYTI
jgi:hypothetical protein